MSGVPSARFLKVPGLYYLARLGRIFGSKTDDMIIVLARYLQPKFKIAGAPLTRFVKLTNR